MNPAKKLYFVNGPVDFACIGGLSFFALLGYWLHDGVSLSMTAAQLSIILSWVINWPHFSATNYRLFRRSQNLREYPLTSLLLPFIVEAAVVASFASPSLVAPYFVKLFLIWSPYHFSGQNVGISLLYARRAGFEFKPWERRALTLFIFSTFLAPSLSAEVGVSTGAQYYDIFYPTLNAPMWMAQIAWALLYGSGAVFVGMTLLRVVQKKPVYPAIVLLPAITQFGWFIVGSRVPSFYYFVPMFHSLQYLLIAWAMHLAERAGEAPKFSATKESGFWFAGNVVGGAILFWGLPLLVSKTGIPLPLATGVLIAGVQIHHFLVDGVIWKLRNPKVAAPLMSSVSDLVPERKAA